MTTVDPTEAIAAVLGRIPSGLFIVTAGNLHNHETGLLASWVQQAAFTPPMVTVAVNAKRYLHDWLTERPVLALSQVADKQTSLLKHFGAGFGPDEPAFNDVPVTRGETGLTLLTEALCWMEGVVRGKLETGDHVIYAIEVLHAARGLQFDAATPYVHLRKNGLRY